MRVRKDDFAIGDEIGGGSFGKVFRVRGAPLGPGVEVAYKEFTTNLDQQARSAERASSFRARLSAADRDTLDLFFAWPQAVVTESGNVVGLLMPLLDDQFFVRFANGKRVTRSIRELGTTDKQRKSTGSTDRRIKHTERLEVFAQLAYALAFLHKHGWVYGDVSQENAMFALDPSRLVLIDCDSAVPVSSGEAQGNTPMWFPPEITDGRTKLQSPATDVYKLALAMCRYAVPGRGATSLVTTERLEHRFDPAAVALVASALGGDPTARPAARDIYLFLYDEIGGRTQAPRIERLDVSTYRCLRGADVWVSWDIGGAPEVTVRAGRDQPVTVSLESYPDGVALSMRTGGVVRVEARNDFGSAWAETPVVLLYDLPTVEVGAITIPVPSIQLGSMTLPMPVPVDLTRALNASVATPRLPAADVSPIAQTAEAARDLMVAMAATTPPRPIGLSTFPAVAWAEDLARRFTSSPNPGGRRP